MLAPGSITLQVHTGVLRCHRCFNSVHTDRMVSKLVMGGLHQNRQKTGHTSQLSDILFRLYSWTVQTGVSVLWPVLRIEHAFCKHGHFPEWKHDWKHVHDLQDS